MLSIDKNQIMIEHFQKILYASAQQISILRQEYIVHIRGENMHILALSKDEVLVEGTFKELTFDHEK